MVLEFLEQEALGRTFCRTVFDEAADLSQDTLHDDDDDDDDDNSTTETN